MHTKTIAYQFGLCSYVLEKNLGGVTHEESLINPQPGGSCLNWIVGHLTRSRNGALGILGQKPMFPMAEFAAYDDSGGTPFRSEQAIPFDELKRRFKALQEPLVNGLSRMSAEVLGQPAPFSPTGNPKETIGSLLASLAFHEAYHVGQSGILRRVIGREGMVKPPRVQV
jgi:DinB superfamily